MSGVDINDGAAISGCMSLPSTCSDCPMIKAGLMRESGGEPAESHFLRVQAVELAHKLALSRAELRRLGVDPDSAYHPHEQDHG